MAEAKLIATHLMEKRLIACANIFPVTSMFRWAGKVTSEPEVAMLCKAVKENFGRIKEETRQLHSYEIPCIVALPWHGSDEHYPIRVPLKLPEERKRSMLPRSLPITATFSFSLSATLAATGSKGVLSPGLHFETPISLRKSFQQVS